MAPTRIPAPLRASLAPDRAAGEVIAAVAIPAKALVLPASPTVCPSVEMKFTVTPDLASSWESLFTVSLPGCDDRHAARNSANVVTDFKRDKSRICTNKTIFCSSTLLIADLNDSGPLTLRIERNSPACHGGDERRVAMIKTCFSVSTLAILSR